MRGFAKLLVVGGLLALPAGLAAQASDNILATATVVAQLTVDGEQNLIFGNVLQGAQANVAPDEGNAGRWAIGGTGTFEVSLDFTTLPSTLLHSGGTETLPISFGATDAGYASNAGATGLVPFDPSVGATTDLVAGALYVFIGGEVDADGAQEPGDYEGTITLEVAYTGL